MKITGLVLVFLIFGVLLWVLYDSTTVFHNKLLKNEQIFRDSIVQNIIDLRKERDNLTKDVQMLQQKLDTKIEDIRRQITNIKINTNVPAINYNSLSDSALVARILSN
jgi:hypothetical protein